MSNLYSRIYIVGGFFIVFVGLLNPAYLIMD